MFMSAYANTVSNDFVVTSNHPANSGPDMLLLLLKAPTNNWAPSSPTRLTSWAFSSSKDFSLTISCLSTGLNPALSKRSRVAPNRTLSLSAFYHSPRHQKDLGFNVRAYRPEHQSDYWWSAVHRIGWDVWAGWALGLRGGGQRTDPAHWYIK